MVLRYQVDLEKNMNIYLFKIILTTKYLLEFPKTQKFYGGAMTEVYADILL